MAAQAKNQHWVPKFYLDYFATPETSSSKIKHVVVIKNPPKDAGTFTTATENICGKRFLYTPKNDDGSRDRSLDDRFDLLETRGADIWRDIATNAALIKEQEYRDFLGNFIATLFLRNLKMVNLVHSTIDLRNKLYGTPSAEQVATRAPNVLDLRNSGKAFIQIFNDSISKSTDTFLSKKWTVFKLESDSFITSDQPVCVYNDGVHGGAPHKLGALIVFPLTPRLAILMSDGGGLLSPDTISADGRTASLFNKLVQGASGNFSITGRPAKSVLLELASAS